MPGRTEQENSQLRKGGIKSYLEGRHAKTDGFNSLNASEEPISERHLRLLGWHPAAQVGQEDYQTNLVIQCARRNKYVFPTCFK